MDASMPQISFAVDYDLNEYLSVVDYYCLVRKNN
jgi:hypothetical protein